MRRNAAVSTSFSTCSHSPGGAIGRHYCCHLSTPVILAIVNIKFIVCSLPYGINSVAETFQELFPIMAIPMTLRWVSENNNRSCFSYFMIVDICNFFVLVQSASNWPLFIQWRSAANMQGEQKFSNLWVNFQVSNSSGVLIAQTLAAAAPETPQSMAIIHFFQPPKWMHYVVDGQHVGNVMAPSLSETELSWHWWRITHRWQTALPTLSMNN